MPKPRGKSGSGGGGGRSTPPQDQGPSGNEFRKDEIVKMTLRPGKFEGETIGEPTQGRRTPPVVFIEKIPPGFFPGEEVEVKIVYASPRRAAGEVVGPEPVVKEIERQLTDALTRSEKFWKENLLTSPITVKSERIQKRERRDGSAQFEYEFLDTHQGHLPLRVFVANLPADWDPSKEATIELAVKSIEIHNRDKRLIGTALATKYPEPKPTPEQEARQHVQELLADIRDPGGSKTFEMGLEQAKAVITKKDSRWVVKDIGEVLFHAEVRLDVPADWSPDQLTVDPVVYEMTDARTEGAKVLIRCKIEGVEPGGRKTDTSKEVKPVKEIKLDVKVKKEFGNSIGEALEPMLSPDLKQSLNVLLDSLDSPELAELKGLPERFTVLEKILEELDGIKKNLINKGAEGDDEALLQIPKLLAQKKKVEAEKTRVGTLIMEAKEVWAGNIAEMKAVMEAPRAGRAGRLERLKPVVQAAVELRVHILTFGDPKKKVLGIKQIDDIDEIRRLQTLNAAVLEQKKDFIDDGTVPEKPGDPDYRLSEMAEDFWVAELMVPEYEARIAELERLASGGPATPAPAPVPIKSALDAGVRVLDIPEPAAAGTTVVEAELTEEPKFEDKLQWLRENGFLAGEFVGLSKKSQRRLERMFGLAPAPESVRIVDIDDLADEVELEFEVGERGTVSIDLLYAMAQESAGFSSRLETAEIEPDSTIEFQEEASLALLRPKMTAWIEAHPGKPLPRKARVEGVDLVAGEVVLDIEGMTDVVRLPLENFSEMVTASKIKVSTDVVPLSAGPSRASLEGVRRFGLFERGVLADIKVGQVYRYNGDPSPRIDPGGDFRVMAVDEEKGLIKVITAKEDVAHKREKRAARTFLIRPDQWNGIPKTFVRGPQPEPRPGASVPEAEEDRLLREIEPGQLYVFEGSERPPFKVRDQFRIQTVDTEEKFIRFSIVREEVEAARQKKKIQVYRLKLKDWKVIPKRLLTGGRGGPSAPPAPSAPPGRPPSTPPAAGAREAAPRRPEPTPVTVSVDESAVASTPSAEPSVRRTSPAPADPLPTRPSTGTEPPPGTVVEASYPPKTGELEVPDSFTELVDLIRNKDLIALAKQEIKKRAGMFGALLAPLVGDPFGDMAKRIERIATDSGAALSVNRTLLERLVDIPAGDNRDALIAELTEQAHSYRETEAEALKYIADQFNKLLSGKKVGTEDERAKMLAAVKKSLEKLQAANDKARKFLEPSAPPPVAPKSGTRRAP